MRRLDIGRILFSVALFYDDASDDVSHSMASCKEIITSFH